MSSLVSTSLRNSLPDHLKAALLPWESEDEFQSLLNDYMRHHSPLGPVEIDLVETLAMISWKRRRIALSERAAHMAMAKQRASLERADPVAMRALCADPTRQRTLTNSYEALRSDDETDHVERVKLERQRQATMAVKCKVGVEGGLEFSEALSALPQDIRDWWQHFQDNPDEGEYSSDLEGLRTFINDDVLKTLADEIEALRQKPLVRQQIHGESTDPVRLEQLHKLDERLLRQYERIADHLRCRGKKAKK